MSLSKMVEMTRIAEDVVRAKVTPRQAVSRIVAVRQRGLEYPQWLQTPAFALMSGAAAPLFGGGWIEILVAFIAGTVQTTSYSSWSITIICHPNNYRLIGWCTDGD